MVNFNRQESTPKLSAASQDALKTLIDTTGDNIFEIAKALEILQDIPRHAALLLAATACLDASMRVTFLAIGATPDQLDSKRKVIRECIEDLVEKLYKEL